MFRSPSALSGVCIGPWGGNTHTETHPACPWEEGCAVKNERQAQARVFLIPEHLELVALGGIVFRNRQSINYKRGLKRISSFSVYFLILSQLQHVVILECVGFCVKDKILFSGCLEGCVFFCSEDLEKDVEFEVVGDAPERIGPKPSEPTSRNISNGSDDGAQPSTSTGNQQ